MNEETELLRAELEAERSARKKVETEHASVSDELQRMRDAAEARAVPVRRAPVKPQDKPSRRLFFRR